MSFDHIKDNFMEYCFGTLVAWVVILMAMNLLWSGIQTAQETFWGADASHNAQDRNARGCLVKDGIQICEKL